MAEKIVAKVEMYYYPKGDKSKQRVTIKPGEECKDFPGNVALNVEAGYIELVPSTK